MGEKANFPQGVKCLSFISIEIPCKKVKVREVKCGKNVKVCNLCGSFSQAYETVVCAFVIVNIKRKGIFYLLFFERGWGNYSRHNVINSVGHTVILCL